MAKKVKEPKAGKAPKGDKPGKKSKEKAPKVKGRLLGRVTNLVAVLFGLSLVAGEVAERVAAAPS